MNLSRLWNSWQIMRQHRFDFLIFFVTGKCNARCQHCFYWKNLDPGHEGPSLSQIEELAHSMPVFRMLVISGGEPTLRDDLPVIVKLFRQYNQIENIVIPTNGLLPTRIAQMAKEIAQVNPGLSIAIHLSLDGFSEVHDRLRGVPGAFDRVIETANNLCRIRTSLSNLKVVVNTVILADNLDDILPLTRYLKENLSLDNHTFGIIRGQPSEKRLKNIPPDRLRQVFTHVLPIQEEYEASGRKENGNSFEIEGVWRQILNIGVLIYQYRLQWRVLAKGGEWDFPCQAGDAIGVVDYTGDYRICELRKQKISLEDFDWDFERARSSKTILAERQIAKRHACDCTHMCFLTTSLRQNPRARFLKAPLLYLRYKLTGEIW